MINKNIITSIIVVLVVVGGAFLLFKSKTPSVFNKITLSNEEKELAEVNSEFSLLKDDEAILAELEQTLNDVNEMVGGINIADAINTAAINQEIDQIKFSNDSFGFGDDDVLLEELKQSFNEVSQ